MSRYIKTFLKILAFSALFLPSLVSAQTPTPTPWPDNYQGNGMKTDASDNINGIYYPRVKPCTGADNSCSDVSGANPMPVSLSGSGSAAEATPLAQVTVAAASVPTAIGTPQLVDTNAKCKTFVQNNTNVDVDVALNGASSNHHRVPAGSEWFEDWCANGQKFSGSIEVNIPNAAATPNTGSVVMGGSSR